MGDSFRRRNSFGILYLQQGKANTDDVFEVLEKINVSIEDVYGVQQIGKSKIIVKLEEYADHLFEKVMEAYDGRIFSIDEKNVNVQIVNISSTKTVVTIKNIPFEFTDGDLEDILSVYGHVHNIRIQCYTSGKLSGKYTGTRTALMTIKRPIPSCLMVRRINLLFFYRDQIKTCLRCGNVGHLAMNCDTGKEDANSRNKDSEFPLLAKQAGGDETSFGQGGNTSTTERQTSDENLEESALGKSVI